MRLDWLALGTAALACVAACAAPPPSPRPTPSPHPGPPCAELGRVNVTLTPAGSRCQAAVSKPGVCVTTGGAILWKINNACRELKSKARPSFEIAQLRVKGTNQPPGWAFVGCTPWLEKVDAGNPPQGNVLLCGVPEDAPPGMYKYDIQGEEIDILDPDIEVRRP